MIDQLVKDSTKEHSYSTHKWVKISKTKLEIPQLETYSSDPKIKESTKIETVCKINQNELRKLKTDSY